MADISQTAASVLAGATAIQGTGVAGEAIVAGEPIYYSATLGQWLKAKSSGTALQSGYVSYPPSVSLPAIAIALNSAPGVGQPVNYFVNGPINLGATLVVGETYVVSTNAGKIAPIGDIAATKFVTVLGVAVSASIMNSPSLQMYASGIQHA